MCKIRQGWTQIKRTRDGEIIRSDTILVVGRFRRLTAEAGFRSPESLVRNVYGYYGRGSSDLSNGLPRDADTAQQFFDRSLRAAWIRSSNQPYDFLVQSTTWKLGAVAISVLRKQFDKTYVAAAFDNRAARSR